jgi:hypothetical protein
MKIFNTSTRLVGTLGAMLAMAIFGLPGIGTATTATRSVAEDIPMAQRLEALHKLSEVSCPQGYEHALPGVYYYCVGIRDIARGKNARARSMLEIAASWGSKQAQFVLGMSYYKGDAQPLDRGRGLAWLGLAAERQNPTYAAIFNSAWNEATAAERARGNRLWHELLPKYGDKRAGRRAERRYRYERTRMLANAVYGAKACVADGTTGQIGSTNQGLGQRPDMQCGQQPVEFIVHKMDRYADHLLDGWTGHVTVGPAQQAPAPSK